MFAPLLTFQDGLSLNAGQKNCRMLQDSILQYFPPSLELPFVVKIFVLSVFEWRFKTGFTILLYFLHESKFSYSGPVFAGSFLIGPCLGRILCTLCFKVLFFFGFLLRGSGS